MAKSAAVTTQRPEFAAAGQDILQEELRAMSRAANWAASYRPECHLSMVTAPGGWDDYSGGGAGLAVGTLAVIITGASVTVIDTDLWISPEMAAQGSIDFGVECLVTDGSTTITTTLTLTGGLGSATAVPTNSQAHNGTERNATVALSGVTNGGEWVRARVATQRTAGAAADCQLRAIRIQEIELTPSALPDPADD